MVPSDVRQVFRLTINDVRVLLAQCGTCSYYLALFFRPRRSIDSILFAHALSMPFLTKRAHG
jgi:hypothetical protein